MPSNKDTAEKPRVEVNPDGNLYNILAVAQGALRNNGQGDKVQEMWDRVREAGDYHKGKKIVQEYVIFK